jgi:hypothetical protein
LAARSRRSERPARRHDQCSRRCGVSTPLCPTVVSGDLQRLRDGGLVTVGVVTVTTRVNVASVLCPSARRALGARISAEELVLVEHGSERTTRV